MSFIPSSAMPHAKPHDEHEHGHKPEHEQHAGSGGSAAVAPTPASAPAPAKPTPSSERQGVSDGKTPWGIALAIGGAIAIGAAATALVFRGRGGSTDKDAGKQPKSARKAGKKSAGQ